MGKRLDLKTGFACNNNCAFCVISRKKKALGGKTTEELKKGMEEGRKACDEIVLTGGEVTIRDDFLELVEFARYLGFNEIQVQTNGRMFAYQDFCIKTVNAGATSFAVSIHGHTPDLHDFLTRAPGSFVQTLAGIRNLKKLGKQVLTNTVVVKPNYRYLPKIAEMLVELNVDQFQFAFVHIQGSAWENKDSIVPVMSLAAPYIKEGLEIGKKAGIKVMAEAVPCCMLKGYEDLVSDMQIPETEIREIGSIDKNFTETRKNAKIKFAKCKSCKFNKKCEGSWEEYPKFFGDEEFVPVN